MKYKAKTTCFILIVIVFTALLLISWKDLSLQEFYSMFSFTFFPEKAKVDHLIKMKKPKANLEIIVLGSVHYQHVETDDYPLWELKSVIKNTNPNAVFVEIRPKAIDNGNWGEGPIEMPFCAFVAKELNYKVHGMDDWSNDMETREDRMVENILLQAQPYKKILIITGYSHVPGFIQRFKDNGFFNVNWAFEDRKCLLKKEVRMKYPDGYKKSYFAVFEKIKAGQSRFDTKWMDRRLQFLDNVK